MGLPPNHQWWHAKWKFSRNACTQRMRVFKRVRADLHAQSEIINKFSASELSRKFIKVVLLVGSEHPTTHSSNPSIVLG